jgi:hypothetical protein
MIDKNSEVGILKDEWIRNDKGGYLSKLDCVMQLSSLSNLIDCVIRFHITPCVFHRSASKNTGIVDYWRNQSNFRCSNYLYFDFDDGGLSSIHVSRQLESAQINHAIIASKNHLRDKHDGKGIIERFHLFIPLETPIYDITVLKDALRYLPIMFNWNVDTSSVDVARYYFKHRECLYHWEHNPKNYEGAFELHTKADKDRYEAKQLQLMKQEEARRKYESRPYQSETRWPPISKFKRTKYFRMLTDGDLRIDGERNAKSNSIIGAMIACGLNEYQVMRLFDEYSCYGTHYTRESIVDRFRRWS